MAPEHLLAYEHAQTLIDSYPYSHLIVSLARDLLRIGFEFPADFAAAIRQLNAAVDGFEDELRARRQIALDSVSELKLSQDVPADLQSEMACLTEEVALTSLDLPRLAVLLRNLEVVIDAASRYLPDHDPQPLEDPRKQQRKLNKRIKDAKRREDRLAESAKEATLILVPADPMAANSPKSVAGLEAAEEIPVDELSVLSEKVAVLVTELTERLHLVNDIQRPLVEEVQAGQEKLASKGSLEALRCFVQVLDRLLASF